MEGSDSLEMNHADTQAVKTDVDEAANLQELTAMIQNVLQQTQDRFQGMSENIIKRIDNMSGRIDDLESQINELMTQAGVEPSQQQASVGGAETPTNQSGAN